MSFINIKDPKKRDAIVAEYLATVKRLQNRGIAERTYDLTRTKEINRVLEPVVRSTAKSTEAITKELIPIREEIHLLNDRIIAQQPPKLEKKDEDDQQHREKEEEEEVEEVVEPPDEPNIVQLYYQRTAHNKIDNYFGIVPDGDWQHYKMGRKRVQIVGPDILVDGRRYKGTKGLWSLIMRKVPSDFSREDMLTYRDLVVHTNAMAYPNNLGHGSQVRRTKKWREIFPLFDTLDEEEEVPPSSSSSPSPPSKSSEGKTGDEGSSNIQYLPGDIKGLETKLNYLLAEYRAGNRSSTRNEIVSILDELLRRRKISRKEYKDINTFLQQ